MTDSTFQILLNELSDAHSKYLNLLGKASDEYKKRFGYYPGDIDDDNWIDTYEANGGGRATVKQITENALIHIKLNQP